MRKFATKFTKEGLTISLPFVMFLYAAQKITLKIVKKSLWFIARRLVFVFFLIVKNLLSSLHLSIITTTLLALFFGLCFNSIQIHEYLGVFSIMLQWRLAANMVCWYGSTFVQLIWFDAEDLNVSYSQHGSLDKARKTAALRLKCITSFQFVAKSY